MVKQKAENGRDEFDVLIIFRNPLPKATGIQRACPELTLWNTTAGAIQWNLF
jgi:hypothetical protein